MNGLALLGLFLVLYGIFVFVLTFTKKPAVIWNMGKIKAFIKVLGETGTMVFFTIFGAAALGVGIWLLVR
jgi:hypothetical protein